MSTIQTHLSGVSTPQTSSLHNDHLDALEAESIYIIREVVAQARPEKKLEIVQNLQAQGRRVGMIGDGINDAPSLARADVGIAMGTGADVAMESAGVTLVRGDLRALADARALSRATISAIRQNLVLAFAYNVLAIPLAASGFLIGFSILACGLAPQLAAHPTVGYSILAVGMVGAASCLTLYGALLRVMLRTTPPEEGLASGR